MLVALLLFAAFFSIVVVGTVLVMVHDFIANRLALSDQLAEVERRTFVPAPQSRRELTRVRTLGHA